MYYSEIASCLVEDAFLFVLSFKSVQIIGRPLNFVYFSCN